MILKHLLTVTSREEDYEVYLETNRDIFEAHMSSSYSSNAEDKADRGASDAGPPPREMKKKRYNRRGRTKRGKRSISIKETTTSEDEANNIKVELNEESPEFLAQNQRVTIIIQ